jgi:hypothetical protein
MAGDLAVLANHLEEFPLARFEILHRVVNILRQSQRISLLTQKF